MEGHGDEPKERLLSRRSLLPFILISMVVVGGIMGYIASTPEVLSLGDLVLEGSVTNETTLLGLAFPSASVADALLEEGQCGLSFYFLRQRELSEFNASGTLPPPNLDCATRGARLRPDVEYLLIQNARGMPSEYRISVSFFQITSPLGILALPAFVLVLVGAIGIALILLRRGLERTVEEIQKKN